MTDPGKIKETWETPRNLTLLLVSVAVLVGVGFGFIGYTSAQEPPPMPQIIIFAPGSIQVPPR